MLIIRLCRQFGHLNLKLHNRTVDLKRTEKKLANLKTHVQITLLLTSNVVVTSLSSVIRSPF